MQFYKILTIGKPDKQSPRLSRSDLLHSRTQDKAQILQPDLKEDENSQIRTCPKVCATKFIELPRKIQSLFTPVFFSTFSKTSVKQFFSCSQLVSFSLPVFIVSELAIFATFNQFLIPRRAFDERVLSLGTYHMTISLFLQSASNPTNDIILSRYDTSFISGIISSTSRPFFL